MKLRTFLRKLSCRHVPDCDQVTAGGITWDRRPTPVRVPESVGLPSGEWSSFDKRAAQSLAKMGAVHGVALRTKTEVRAGVQSVYFS